MNQRRLIIKLILTFTFLTVVAIQAAEDFKQIEGKMNDADPKVRIAALSTLTKLALDKPEKLKPEALPIFVNALSEKDHDVRYNALCELTFTIVSEKSRLGDGRRDSLKIGDFPNLKASLEKLLDDPDTLIRENALRSYVNLYELDANMQAHLISQLASEGKYGNQELILESLADSVAPTDAAIDCLIKNLDDPAYRQRIAFTWASSEVKPPSKALPKLAMLLSTTSSTSNRQAYARAITRYEAAAKPYLNDIAVLYDRETDPITKRALKESKDSIRKN